MLIVQKYGGSSVSDPGRVRRCAARIAREYRRGTRLTVVLSAQGDTTDELLARAGEYNANPSRRELDMLLATGEQTSVALMAMALEDLGLPCVSLTGWQAGVDTDDTYGSAHIRAVRPERIRAELDAGKIVLVCGFQGLSPASDITTLGRGGSDTTAVALTAALHADKCLIFTDVDGVYTADPRLVPEARKLPAVDTAEMLRLAALGSQVLHDRSVELALRRNVPLEVLSSFTEAPGTEIRPLPLPEGEGRLTALTRQGSVVTLVGSGLRTFPDLSRRGLRALAEAGIVVHSYLENDGRLSFTVPETDSIAALRALHRAYWT